MNKNLLLEIKGRSLKLFAYSFEVRVMEKLRRDLVAYSVEAERKGLTSKQQEMDMRAITDKAFKRSESGLIKAVAKDVLSNLKLTLKHLGGE